MRTLSTPASAALASGHAAIVQLIHIAFPSGTVALNTSNWHLPWHHNFSRASTATYFNSAGVLTTAAINEPRVAYDPLTLRCLGFLAEGAAINLATYSQSLDNASGWADIGVPTVTANTTTAPDGSTTADTVADTSAVAFQGRTKTINITNDSASRVVSLFVKKTTGGTSPTFAVNFRLVGGAALTVFCRLNKDTGASFNSGAASTVLVSSAGAYWRLSCSITNNASGNNQILVDIYPASSAYNGGLADVVTATGSADVWGVQVEDGLVPTSYIPTTTVAATRAADIGAVTYQGAYGLGSVSPITDKPGELQGITLELAGGDTARIALALDDADEVQGTPLTIRTAIIDTTSYAIVDAPVDWVGLLDTMSIAEDGQQATIRVTAESKAVDLLRGNPAYYSSSDQRVLAPLDGSFDYVVDQDGKADVWPSRSFFYR